MALTAYCLVAPRLKERRFRARYGARFDAYAAQTPYMVPRLSPFGREAVNGGTGRRLKRKWGRIKGEGCGPSRVREGWHGGRGRDQPPFP